MTAYVALLRGINVGKVRIAMPDLRRLFADLGHPDATTHQQTGNVIFTSTSADPAGLATRIEQRITSELKFSVAVLIRSGKELARVVDGRPFPDWAGDPTQLLVTFLAEPPAADRIGKLVRPDGETAEFALAGREVYLHCPDGYGRTKLSNAFLERRLGVVATTRNWRTVTALRELTAG